MMKRIINTAQKLKPKPQVVVDADKTRQQREQAYEQRLRNARAEKKSYGR